VGHSRKKSYGPASYSYFLFALEIHERRWIFIGAFIYHSLCPRSHFPMGVSAHKAVLVLTLCSLVTIGLIDTFIDISAYGMKPDMCSVVCHIIQPAWIFTDTVPDPKVIKESLYRLWIYAPPISGLNTNVQN
jgi:hypothetical protein